MKKAIIILGLLLSGGVLITSIGQNDKKKEITKEVKVEDVDGEITMTIITSQNGESTREVYKGEAANEKMKELEGTYTIDSEGAIEKQSNRKDGKSEEIIIKKKVIER